MEAATRDNTTAQPTTHDIAATSTFAADATISKQPKQSWLRRFRSAVDSGLTRAAYQLGLLCGKHPWKVIGATVLITALCMIGLIRFGVETDDYQLWTPTSAESFKDKPWVEKTYGYGNTQVKLLALAASKGPTSANVLTKPRLLELLRLHESITSSSVSWKGKTYNYTSYCDAVDTPAGRICKIESILAKWNFSRDALNSDPDILATINDPAIGTSWDGTPLNLNRLLGGSLRDPATGTISSSEVIQHIIYLQNNPVEIDLQTFDRVARKWENKILDLGYNNWQSKEIRVLVASNESIGKESDKAIQNDITLLTIGYILCIAYTMLVLWRNSWAYNKVQMTLPGVIAIGMAVASSFGLVTGVGITFNLVVQVLPFILLGLGLDNVFVIIGSYFHTDPNTPVEQRIAEAMAEGGVSIIITNVTDIVAFAVGANTALPALQDFCIYATFGMFFVFVYQVTFFPACLALEARRELRVRQGSSSCSGCCGKGQEADVEALPVGKEAEPLPITTAKICCGGEFDPHRPTFLTKLISQWMPKVTLHPVGKIVVILIELALLAMAIYGCTKVYMDFQFRDWFVPEGSWLKEGFNIESQYFGGETTPFTVYTKQAVDGRDYFYYQDEILAVGDRLRNSSYVNKVPPVDSWLESFNSWLQANPAYNTSLTPEGRAPNATAFNSWLKVWLQGEGRLYSSALKLADNGTILSSQIGAFSEGYVDGSWAVRYVDAARAATKPAANLSAIAYDTTFLFYDGLAKITWETIRNVITTAAVVFGIVFVLTADFMAMLLVGLMVVLCDVMLFGYMHWVDLQFNTVTAINLILAVGIAVDYSAHIIRAFQVSRGTRHDRAWAALGVVGGEVLSGAITTILCVVVMGFAQHYIFQVFFKMFFALVLFALWHGVVVLPVLLSWVGPGEIVE